MIQEITKITCISNSLIKRRAFTMKGNLKRSFLRVHLKFETSSISIEWRFEFVFQPVIIYRLTHSASELSGCTCTSSLTMQYRTRPPSQLKPWCNDSGVLNLHHGYYTTTMTSRRLFLHNPVSRGTNQPIRNSELVQCIKFE